MFDLTKSIDLWKMDFYKNAAFTKDDIDELEAHLLDKIEELIERGLSQEEAFIKAKDTLGSAEILHQDFHIVNNMKVLGKKIILGLCGYIFIFSIINLITSFTTVIMLPFVNNLVNLPSIKIPIIGSLQRAMFGSNSSSIVSIKFFVNMILGITVVYFLLSKKRNVINWSINKFNSSIKNKIYSIITVVLMPIVSFAIWVLVIPRGVKSATLELYNGDFMFSFIFKFIIIMAFSYILYKKYKETKNSLWILTGYIIGLTFIEVMPEIITDIIVLLNISGIAAKIVFFTSCILIMVAMLYLIIFSKVKLFTNIENKCKLVTGDNKKIRLLVSLITFVVLSSIILIPNVMSVFISRPDIPTITLGELSMLRSFMQLIIIVLVQVTASVMLMKRTKRKIA